MSANRPASAPLDDIVPTTGQLSKADVRRLYDAHRYDDIEAARTSGRLNDLLAGRPVRRSTTDEG